MSDTPVPDTAPHTAENGAAKSAETLPPEAQKRLEALAECFQGAYLEAFDKLFVEAFPGQVTDLEAVDRQGWAMLLGVAVKGAQLAGFSREDVTEMWTQIAAANLDELG